MEVAIDWKNVDLSLFAKDQQNYNWASAVFDDHHEIFLKKVLEKYLNRTPTLADAELCTRINKIDWVNKYGLAYNGINLGIISWELGLGEYHNEVKFTFTPSFT